MADHGKNTVYWILGDGLDRTSLINLCTIRCVALGKLMFALLLVVEIRQAARQREQDHEAVEGRGGDGSAGLVRHLI